MYVHNKGGGKAMTHFGRLIQANLTSFGYGHGPAPDATIVVDTRDILHDPHTDSTMRDLTGQNREVQNHVLDTPGAAHLVSNLSELVMDLLFEAGESRGVRVDVAIGCVGGRHRAPVLIEHLSRQLERGGIVTDVTHRDIDKPVLNRA
jgi:RNase adaptor protein for sRNA GlmZ degradation